MTIPTLMQNHQRKVYVTQLHKVYNEFSQALMQYQSDRNAINLSEAGLISQEALDSFIKKYFKIVQECESTDDCFASEYKTLQGNEFTTFVSDVNVFVLASGASIRPYYAPQGNSLVSVGVDVNGKSGPNILGRDLIFFAVYKNGLIDDYTSEDANAPLTEAARDNMFDTECNAGASTSGWGCFGKILNDNWEMTY